jgi:flagellar biosynthesis protein FlhB
MADEQDESQKTEDPTRKRFEEAEERGQVASSREANHFLLLVALTFVLGWMGPNLLNRTQSSLSKFIERPETLTVSERGIGAMLTDVVQSAGGILFIPFVIFICAVFASSFIQNNFVLSLEPIIPKLEKISPMKGFSRLFSMRSFVEFLKSIIKIVITGVVAWYAVLPYFSHVEKLPQSTIFGMLSYLSLTTQRMLIGICIVMFFLALMDYLYQRYQYIKSLRMTKQEIKDEYKQQEGDPHVKHRLRQIRMERARKRMMAAVPTADVIVTNPTHYSIALKYDSASMQAPRVVAKGLDNIALRIREVAREHDIPLVENPPLAQALYATVEIDQEVPAEHYKAVAEVITYVYRLKGKLPPKR